MSKKYFYSFSTGMYTHVCEDQKLVWSIYILRERLIYMCVCV